MTTTDRALMGRALEAGHRAGLKAGAKAQPCDNREGWALEAALRYVGRLKQRLTISQQVQVMGWYGHGYYFSLTAAMENAGVIPVRVEKCPGWVA